MTVGFAGIGRMGLPMARNLLQAGFPLLVWNRTPDRCGPLVEEGATAVDDPSALAAADVVVTMLADGSVVRKVLLESGLLDALRAGAVVLEMSTIGPEAAIELAREAQRRAVRFVDAPVSGSVAVAESAQLFAMAGGEPDAYQAVAPVLDAMTKGHALLGSAGAGAAMKLAVNSMIAVTNEAIAETIVFAERFGIASDDAYDVLASGALASPFVLYKRGAFMHPDTEPVAFTTTLMLKDVMLARALAAELGIPLPAAGAAGEILEKAVHAGLADADMASVLGLLRELATSASSPTNAKEDS